MSFVELFMIAVGLFMDVFAVSVCKGLSIEKLHPKYAVLTGCYFGVFQAISIYSIGLYLTEYAAGGP